MKGVVGHEMPQHAETRKGSPGNKKKKDKLLASRHETIGKAWMDGWMGMGKRRK
jgi:hypothetical protein